MNRLIKLLFILITLELTSCRSQLPPEPPYPYTHIQRLAICPLLFQPDRDEQGELLMLDSELLGRILAEEWTKFQHDKGLTIIFPRETAAVMIDKEIIPDSPGNIRKLGRLLKADAVCLIQLNHYQPYIPKSSTLTFQLYGTTVEEFETQKIVNITQLGSDLEEETGLVELAVIQRRWDGKDEKLRRRAEKWSNRKKDVSRASWENVFRIESEYFRFIFNATIRDYIEALNERIEMEQEKINKAKREAERLERAKNKTEWPE